MIDIISYQDNKPFQLFGMFFNTYLNTDFFNNIITGQDCPDGVPVTYVKYSNSAPRSVVQPILLYASTPGVAITAECYNR